MGRRTAVSTTGLPAAPSLDRLRYNDPADRLETLGSELVKILTILLGIGLPALLRGRWAGLWLVGAAAGLLGIVFGLFFLLRRARRQLAALDSAQPPAVDSPSAGQEKTPDQPGAAQAVGSAPNPQPDTNPPAKPAGWTARFAQAWQRLVGWMGVQFAALRRLLNALLHPSHPLTALPAVVVLTGVFIFVPAVSAALFKQLNVSNFDLIEIYFSSPAVLVWIIGELVYVFPRLVARPKHFSAVAGIVRSVLQVLAALLLWIFLGLSIGRAALALLLWLSIGLALAGLLCGMAADASERGG